MKRLGQHFLRSKKIVRKIAEAAEIQKNNVILEVGPGRGVLTEELLKRAKTVIAIEKDRRLVNFLAEKFAPEIERGFLVLIKGDILKIQNSKCKVQNENAKFKKLKNYKVVANIPYYITSRFLRNFLSAENQPQKMVLMVQKEVAERICASPAQVFVKQKFSAGKPPKMNLLAISVQVYGEPKILFNVSKKYFSPPPKVDSAVIAINNISRAFFENFNEIKKSLLLRHGAIKENKIDAREEEFFQLVKNGFAQKRKLLINNLLKFKKEDKNPEIAFQGKTEEKKKSRAVAMKKARNTKKIKMEKIFQKCRIPLKSRAENLSPSDWKRIYRFLTIF